MPEDCLFCRMSRGEIPVEMVVQNEKVFAIRDINPRAPIHDLVIPREHIDNARDLDWSHAELLSALFTTAREVARVEGVFERGYRLAFNVGDDAGMTIHHLHLHLVGGRKLGPEG
ncbi:MAG: histidine triad nucleotide-binding protein [Hyphomicrobiales bacterium]